MRLSFPINKYRLTGILLILIIGIALTAFPEARKSINYYTAYALKTAGGEKAPSSDIIIVHITEEDVNNLGGSWPLKRSYYALLINRLNKLNAGIIGFEIFLSPLTNAQSIYNETLLAEIQKLKTKIVFSSLLENARNNGREIYADSAVYPFPKYALSGIFTGHLNYYDDYGFYIPARALLKNGGEDSFYKAVLEKYNGSDIGPEFIKLNISSSWKEFKNYSFIEFIKFSETKEAANLFSGKIVLFGVSDPKIAKTFSSSFNGELPGIALHAFAINNRLAGSYINENYKFISAILFLFIAGAVVFFSKKKLLVYSGAAASILIISFGLLYFLNIELNYSFFIVPVAALGVYDFIKYLAEHKRKIKVFEAESVVMKEELAAKQAALNRLQSELNLSPEEGQAEILKKISELKLEISALKDAGEDKEPAEPQSLQASNFYGIVYKNRKMAAVIDLLKKVAPENASVLIYGESGAGKELFARAIHELSPRRGKNFIAVNCAALSETLLESELFGHVKGSFTNAVSDKLGRFEAADKGTIFLDEIGETTENFQTKLLRILQSGTFEKVGSSKTISADVRVVAATNKKLEDLIAGKKFREDLYYRLNVIKLEIPPLRERKDDIELLAHTFLPEELSLSKSVLERFLLYDWKGNVRELESAVKRAAILAKAENRTIVQLKDIPHEIAGMKKDILYERIMDSLREKKFSHSSMTDTAKELEIGRTAVSENFRGYILKAYYENNFDIQKTVSSISQSEDGEINDKVKSKIDTILENLSADIKKNGIKDKDEFKKSFPAKYKNMPQSFHFFQDEVIRHMLSSHK